MKVLFKAAFAVAVVLLVSACGQKPIQPIQSLSDAHIGQLNVTDVSVKWGDIFTSKLDEEKAELTTLQEKLDGIPVDGNRGQRTLRTNTIKKIESQEKRISRLEESLVKVPQDVKLGIETAVAEMVEGSKDVKLDVTINSFSLTNGASVMLIGGSDSMNAVVSVVDNSTQDVIGEYLVTDMDTNAAGGLLGLMVRGTDARGDMIKQFSEKVVELLSVSDAT